MKDAIALVTGATGGLGQAIAAGLAARGATVLVHYRRNGDVAAVLCESIRESGGTAEVVTFDLRDAEAIGEAFAAIRKDHGQLDILVNNAGIVADGPFVLLDDGGWNDVIDTNLGGTFRVCRAAARLMMARKRGVIVNVSSVAGLRASPYQANYSAAKAGILGLTRTMARELGPNGIRVNAVIPGLILSGMGERMDQRLADAVIERIPLAHPGQAEDVAAAVVFLASSAAKYITGAELTVDGGLST